MTHRSIIAVLWALALSLGHGVAYAGAFAPNLRQGIETLTAKFDGRVGICTMDVASAESVCLNGDQRFSLQSVMKLFVGAAILDAEVSGKLRLDDAVVVRRKDLSLGAQPLADIVRKNGDLTTTIEDLVRRAVIESDSTAADVLVDRLGGIAMVQEFLTRRGVEGIRLDRDERHLQAEVSGMLWRPEFSDAETYAKALKLVSDEARSKAYAAYLKDPRDTATPAGMVAFLKDLALGKVLPEPATKKLLAIMAATTTGKDRLRAGLRKGWAIGHKTGTSSSWKGMTAATNDVGILTAPDGALVAIAVFVADSRRPNAERAAILAQSARLVTASYRSALKPSR